MQDSGTPQPGACVKVRFPSGRTLEIHVPGARSHGCGTSDSLEPFFQVRCGNLILKKSVLPGKFCGCERHSAVCASFVLECGAVLELNIPGAIGAGGSGSAYARRWFIVRTATRAIVRQGSLPREFFEFD